MLEFGTATNILAILFVIECASNSNEPSEENNKSKFACNDIVTSDVDDQYGDVLDNVQHYFKINNFREES